MNYLTPFRDKAVVDALVEKIHQAVQPGRTYKFMEVCGTHTVAIARNGLRRLLPEGVILVSGPGCPVCVTSTAYIDKALALAELDDVILTTFGDMVRVPGSRTNLEWAKARGARVQVVLSPLDALKLARAQPGKQVIFLGIGFETTVPTVAAAIQMAHAAGQKNFSVLAAHKTMPVPMRVLVSDPDIRVEGYLCPGHVCTITGPAPFQALAEEFNIPAVIAGFEATDILRGMLALVEQRNNGQGTCENVYRRSVAKAGNPKAWGLVETIFEPADSWWRGLGVLPGSGLAIRPAFEAHDADKVFSVTVPEGSEPKGCRCGDVLKGICQPPDCPLFKKACTPEKPIGACMVSGEGACAAAYKWGLS